MDPAMRTRARAREGRQGLLALDALLGLALLRGQWRRAQTLG
jgi:hypothetical protein